MTTTTHGSCLCGAVRFTAALPVKWVAHCHCSYCRRAHGAAFVTWAGFPAAQFSIDPSATQPAWYESSPGAKRGFCPKCGSPMFFESTRWPGEMHVARALIQGELDKAPAAHVFYETHVSWLEVSDGLPRKVSQENP
ncbi:MAG: GFA family protein [Betaproteobacteria bacterium]